MKIIVRDKHMGLYLHGPSNWRGTQNQAMQFDDSAAALDFCSKHGVQDVELLLLTVDARLETPLRLLPLRNLPMTFLPPIRMQPPSTVEL